MSGTFVVSAGVHDRTSALYAFDHATLESKLVPVSPPSWFSLRDGTTDREVWDSVCKQNEYRLPERLHHDDVVIDVGAHVGTFALACWQRGCRFIQCYEPALENFAALEANVKGMPGVRAYRLAVWSSEREGLACYLDEAARGHPSRSVWYKVAESGGGEGVGSVSLDGVVAGLGGRRVAFLKLDCEGAEYEILMNSQSLHLVDRVAMEVHGDPAPLVERLAAAGLAVGVEPSADHPGALALLFARRPG